MKDKIQFDGRYFVKFLVLLVVELLIALFVHDAFIRPYIGDVLVMLLMYAFVKSFYRSPTKRLPVYLFGIACLIEISQLIKVLDLLNLSDSKLLTIVFGSVFDIKDIMCYAVGMALLIIWEQLLRKNIAYL